MRYSKDMGNGRINGGHDMTSQKENRDDLTGIAPGEGVTYCLNGDETPCTVISSTPTTIWVRRDEVAMAPEKFTRRKDGIWRPRGSACGRLIRGRSSYRDPHV